MENERNEAVCEETRPFIGVCEFCGQTFAVDACSPEQANVLATSRCRCDGAAKKERVETMIESGWDSVGSLFGENCEAYGFRPVEDAEVIRLLNDIVVLTANDLLLTTSVTISGYGVAQISRKTDGKLKIIRTRTLKKTEETR